MTDQYPLISAVCHLIEHIDTGEPMDLVAAKSMLQVCGFKEFAEQNAVMLPLRRDGVSQADRIDSL